jgi:hypothetical protein
MPSPWMRPGSGCTTRRCSTTNRSFARLFDKLTPHGTLLVVADEPTTSALPVAVARAYGHHRSPYLPGLAMRRIADLHPGTARLTPVTPSSSLAPPAPCKGRHRRRHPRRAGRAGQARRRPGRRGHLNLQPHLRSAHQHPSGPGTRSRTPNYHAAVLEILSRCGGTGRDRQGRSFAEKVCSTAMEVDEPGVVWPQVGGGAFSPH